MQGRRLGVLYSRLALKVGLNDVVDLFVEYSQGNVGRTGFLSHPAIHAAAEHVKSPKQVEHGKVRGDFSFSNHIFAF